MLMKNTRRAAREARSWKDALVITGGLLLANLLIVALMLSLLALARACGLK